jgi:polysaccharide pyruvyl transferase WcaK-like protein
MPVALLAGAFGQKNLGDDALLQAFVDALPEWQLAVTTADPEGARRLGCQPVRSGEPRAVARAVTRADAVVIGGGTVLKTLHPSTARHPHGLLANASALVAVASTLRRPVAMVGIGAGHLDDRRARALARFAVRRADLLVLRDEESADEMTRAGVPGPFLIGADPAWTLVPPLAEVTVPHGRTVRVIPSHLANGTDGWTGMVDRLADTVARLLAAGLGVQVQAWQGGSGSPITDDHTIVEALVHRFGSSVEVVPPPVSLPEAVASMVGLGTVLSFRFHGLLASAAAGIPSVAVTHEAKLSALARRLGQRSAPPGFEPSFLAAQVADAVSSPGPTTACVNGQIAQAREGFRLLHVLLDAGQSDESDRLGALPLVPSPGTPISPSRSA